MAKKDKVKKVVLSYSGGLDTSVIVPWLKNNYRRVRGHLFYGGSGPERGSKRIRQKSRGLRREQAHHRT